MIKGTSLSPHDVDNTSMSSGELVSVVSVKLIVFNMRQEHSQQVLLQGILGVKERIVKLYVNLFLCQRDTFLTHKIQGLKLCDYPKAG